jgi:hypothetical protein
MQKYVRLKDFSFNGGFCKCVTCGKTGHWKEFDGGHFISRTYTIHKILEENIHPQCKGCNRFAHKCHDDYSMFMIDTYGDEFVRNLIDTKRTVMKYDRQELLETQKELKAKIKDLENEY